MSLYLVQLLRYSASNNVVTLSLALFDRSYTTYCKYNFILYHVDLLTDAENIVTLKFGLGLQMIERH